MATFLDPLVTLYLTRGLPTSFPREPCHFPAPCTRSHKQGHPSSVFCQVFLRVCHIIIVSGTSELWVFRFFLSQLWQYVFVSSTFWVLSRSSSNWHQLFTALSESLSCVRWWCPTSIPGSYGSLCGQCLPPYWAATFSLWLYYPPPC